MQTINRLAPNQPSLSGGMLAAQEIATKVAGFKAGDRKLHIVQAAQAAEQFDAQQTKLQELAKSGGR